MSSLYVRDSSNELSRQGCVLSFSFLTFSSEFANMTLLEGAAGVLPEFFDNSQHQHRSPRQARK